MSLDYRQKVFLILTVLWMGVIFWFSAAPADESSDMSMSVGKIVAARLAADFDTWSEEEQIAYIERIDHPVRKMAHATEFAVLAFLGTGALAGESEKERRKGRNLAWRLAALYAVTDELHQIFVPGRSCQVTDVMIDSAGAVVGALVCFWILGMISSRKPHLVDEMGQ